MNALFLKELGLYKFEEIHALHFLQTADEARLPKVTIRSAIDEIVKTAIDALGKIEAPPPVTSGPPA